MFTISSVHLSICPAAAIFVHIVTKDKEFQPPCICESDHISWRLQVSQYSLKPFFKCNMWRFQFCCIYYYHFEDFIIFNYAISICFYLCLSGPTRTGARNWLLHTIALLKSVKVTTEKGKGTEFNMIYQNNI